MRIITYGGYFPYRGYINGDFNGQTLLQSGAYIQFPQNSNRQRWIKRETSKRVRNSSGMKNKGNYYRRLFDYWWTLD